MTTIREHLEAILDRHKCYVDHSTNTFPVCGDGCDGMWPCPDRQDAATALAILDGANRQNCPLDDALCIHRMVPDPEQVTA